MTTVRPTIGVFAGIFNKEGKLLVKQRERPESLPGEWDLPGGGVEEDAAKNALDERVIGQELFREVFEETGLRFSEIQPMPAMYPAISKGGTDFAFAIIIGKIDKVPTMGEWKFVSPSDLEELANGPEGYRLVSGYGKRMHRMCLRMLASRDSPNADYQRQAGAMLQKIQEQE